MKRLKRLLALMLTLSIAFTLTPAQTIAQNEDGAVIHRPSGNTYSTRVSYEIVTAGKAGETASDTRAAVVRFNLDDPGEQPVSFNYSVLSGSAEDMYISGATSGEVVLSQAEPEKEVMIEITPFADKPGDYALPNDPNTYWTGEHYLYLYCSDIQNALFDGDCVSLTVPVPVESGFDYEAAYENAVNTELIDFDEADGGSDGIYPVPESGELRFTAEISGDIRKMLDDSVFTHIHLPQGHLLNESEEPREIIYEIKAKNDMPPREALMTRSQAFSLEANSRTSFFSDGSAQCIPVGVVNLGAFDEGNGTYNKLDFIFSNTDSTTPGAVSVSFSDEAGQYLQRQVNFSDQAPPQVTQVSTDIPQAHYGDVIPVTIGFSEPIRIDGITFTVDGQVIRPMEREGTISQKVSFLYRVGDEALDDGSFAVNVSDITGAIDLSGKAAEDSASDSASVDILFDPMLTFAYCAEPSVSLDQGTGRNMSAAVLIPIKQDTSLSNWLLDDSRLSEGNISTAVKARAITAEGTIDIPLTVQTDILRVTGLTGSFTAPENDTGECVFYVLEIYMDTGSGYKPIDSLATVYPVQPLILVDDETVITLNYIYWPPADQIFVNAGTSLALGYILNVDATWVGPEYFIWSSSDESVAQIDENGMILLTGTGQVCFTLAVSNPLNEDVVSFTSRTLTVLESQDAYLYVPNGIKNQDILTGSDAKISFSSNLTDRNDMYGGPGTETSYTFTLYEVIYDDDSMEKGSILSSETLKAAAQAPLNSYTVPGGMLTKVTEKNKYGYILEISAPDMQSGSTLTAQANIRVRQMPAKASLIRPESVFLLDSADGFTVEFDIENKASDTQFSLDVTRNSDAAPVISTAAPATIRPVDVNISTVDSSRLLDVYTVSLKAKNLSDEAWSFDSYNVYVYNSSAMRMLVDGFPNPGSLTMGYDFEDEEIIRNINFLQIRSAIGKELLRTVKIDDRSYVWSAIADRVTWKVDGESVSLWYSGKRIGDDYNPVLLPGTSLLLRGDSPGSSVVTADHTLTGMTGSMTVTLKPLQDKLYLFRVYPEALCEMVYTNGRGEEKSVVFSGEVGVYEESGIKGDVAFYPTGGAENVYGFNVIPHRTLIANQNSGSSFDLYPVNTVRLPIFNYNVTLELFDETTGEPYTGDIIVRGGVYYNDRYQQTTTINGKAGNGDQRVSADVKGRYTLAFRPADFTGRLLASDKLRYVIEVDSADNSHFPQYITIENDEIQAQRNSPLGVCVSKGVKAMNASSIQNGAIVFSQKFTIDGEERPMTKRLYIEEMPQSAELDMTVMVPYSSKDTYYRLKFVDPSTGLIASSPIGEQFHAYPFSDMVTLHFSFDFKKTISLALFALEPGQTGYYRPIISSTDGNWELKLSYQFEIQNLHDIPDMSYSLQYGKPGSEEYGDLTKIYMHFWNMYKSSEMISFAEDKDAVKEALEMMKGYYIDTNSLGLELKSTEDPLVYKGIIRFAVGSYSKDNPSGVFVGSGEHTSFKFMPGFSDTKAMAKGTYLKKAKEEMNKSRGLYKTYGGGAYVECLVYYSIEEREWKTSLIYGDFYLGGGGTYYRTYNGWVSFIPVTSSFEFSMTAELGLTILNSQVRNETAYIPRLRPVFSIYGFGGVGFDYKFVAFKAGGYGFAEHEQNYLWYTDSNGLKMDGQQLKIRGEVGVEYKIWLAFIKLSGKYVLADYSNSWNYNEYNEIQQKIAENEMERSAKKLIAPGEFSGSSKSAVLSGSGESPMLVLVPVEESIAFEDRSYLEAYERTWGSPGSDSGSGSGSVIGLGGGSGSGSDGGLSSGSIIGSGSRSGSESSRGMFALLSSEDLTNIWANAYPNAMPQLSDDGEMMVYLSDMGSEDLSDTAVLFAVKDGAGSFSEEGTEIHASDFPDSSPYLSGTGEGASAVWVRSFADVDGEAGSTAVMEDVINGLAASEVMAGIYKDGVFTAARLTDNIDPDLAPVTAASGDRAIAVWRSVKLGNMENPLDFTSDYIMYSIYDGSKWSEARCLFEGSIDRIRALNTAMLPDGTSAIVYQITEEGGDSEIICAVLDTNGEVVRTLRLTDNMTEDADPQITTAEFHDGAKRFVIGWNAQTERAESAVQMAAVNREGTLYSDFSLEVSDSTGAANYSNFRFTKGADRLEDLSLIWSQPGDADKDGTYEYGVYGIRLLVSDGNTASASGRQKLLALEEGRSLDSLDARVDPNTGKIHFVMLLTEANGESTLAAAVSEYENDFTVMEPEHGYEDLLPGLDMPVLFTVQNDGVDAITHIAIELHGQTFEFDDESIASGETGTYLVSYHVPETLADADFSVTAQFGEAGVTCIHTGVLKLGLPDVGIHQINITRETQRERGFRVLLRNTAFTGLKKGTHTVNLEIWDHSNFTDGSPLKTITVSEDDFDALNNSLLSVDVTLTEDDLQQLLDEKGELPEGGAWLLFRTVLAEGGNVIDDTDISNDTDFVNIYSLIENNGAAVSLTSLSETADGMTTVQVEAFNNSMQPINNGNIIVTLRDERGNALETRQTYDSSDGGGLLAIPGEDSKTASVQFSHTGYTADVTFARVSGESSLLSAMSLTGVPMEFDPNVFEYDLKSYGLSQTILTAVTEDPESAVTVAKNGVPVSTESPIAMSYGTTVFVITVTTGGTDTTYTVKVENNRLDEGTDPEDDDPVTPDKPDGGTSGDFLAELTIDGVRQRSLGIIRRDGRAVVPLGALAQEIFSGITDAALDIPLIPGVKGYTLEVPANFLAGQYTGATVTVSTELGSLRIPAGMLTGTEGTEGKTAGITIDAADKSMFPENIKAAIGDRPIISLTFTLDGEQIDWSNPDAPVTVSIPYMPTADELANPESIVVWYIDGSGNVVCVPNGRYEPLTGTVTFSTTHFSYYAVSYNQAEFKDVPKDAWYARAVSFIAARGITTGTGGGNFSPEAKLTRGQFIVMLMRAYGIAPEADPKPKDNFADAGDTWYTGYLAAAKRLGISAGIGNDMFAPEKEVTRQEMFTMMYNALKVVGQLPGGVSGKTLSEFSDADEIAPWAVEAMTLFVEAGIINGYAGKLTPADITTRAHMAQVLHIMMGK